MKNKFIHENEKQIQAIIHKLGSNLIIIAGPGTGKTRVITKRINYLMEELDVDPSNILVLAYTNRAINEIMSRMDKFEFLNLKFSGTIHSIAKKLINEHVDNLKRLSKGKYTGIKIFDDNDSYYLIKKWWIEIENKDIKTFESQYKTLIKYIRNTKHYCYLKFGNNYTIEHRLYGDEKDIKDIKLLTKCFDYYQKHLDEMKFMDFEDLLIWFHQLLLDSESNLRKWCQENFQFILVDEFQDMNILQLKILKEMSGENYNICCVGDPNQAIYSFQGAHPKIFTEFKKLFPNKVSEINLSENYRSNENIVDLSNISISHNFKNQKVNKLINANIPWHHSATNDDKKIVFVKTNSFKKEFNTLIDLINQLKSKGVLMKNIAILYRSGWIAQTLKSTFVKNNIKFIDYNLVRLLESSTLQLIICFAYLTYFDNSFAIEYILKFLNKEDKIMKATLKEIQKLSINKYEKNFYLSLMNIDIKLLIEEDSKIIVNLRDMISAMRLKKHEEIKLNIQELSWFFKGVLGDVKRYLKINLNCQFYSLKRFINLNKFVLSREISFIDFLDFVMPYVKFLNSKLENDFLNISTIHSVKGCEFDYVFVMKLKEGIIPSSYALNEKKGKNIYIKSTIEEERRMFYVAITRAKKGLFLFHTDSSKKKDEKSRFIKELFSKKINYLVEKEVL